MSKARPRTIEVEIYDRRYSIVLQAPLEESDVRKLADEIDSRMREISAASKTADSLKIAVLTALHLAQEFREHKIRCEQNETLIRTKSEQWTHLFEQVLKK